MADSSHIIPGCNCPSHQEIYQRWPQSNAIIHVSTCMRICPYCGKKHSNASRLRKHLKTYTYRSRNLKVAAEQAGVKVRVPQYDVTSSGTRSTTPNTKEKTTSPRDHTTNFKLCQNELFLLENLLAEIRMTFGAAFGGLIHTNLCPLIEIPSTVRLLWLSTTTSLPTIFEASQCWPSRKPSVHELVIETLNCITGTEHQTRPPSENDFRVNYRGEVNESVDPRTSIAQLLDPDPTCPVFLTGLRLPIMGDLGFRSPYDLCAVVEPMEECNVQINVTPRFSFVDLHIDYGADGVSTLVGECRKIWLLYPPTIANLTAMKTVDGQRAKLLRIMHQLEGGLAVEMTAAHVIYIPAGCIHATFTLQGGFLVAEDFTTSKSITAITAYITNGLDQTLTPQAREACFSWFERCLDVSLAHQQLKTALEAWVRAQSHLAAWASSHRQWRTHVRRLWEQHLHDATDLCCPCGMQSKDVALRQHFFSNHLDFVLPPSRLRR